MSDKTTGLRWPVSQPRAPQWHRWFAWHPVTIGSERVWLTTIERRCTIYGGGAGDWIVEKEYRDV